jgi:hypothetical protein
VTKLFSVLYFFNKGMNMKLSHLLFSLCLATSPTAFAGDDHDDKPKHGGIVATANHVTYELVAKPDMLALHVSDHGKVVKVAGGTAKLTILNGSEKSEAALAAEGNALMAKGAFKVGSGAKIVAVVSLPNAAAKTVRFTVK